MSVASLYWEDSIPQIMIKTMSNVDAHLWQEVMEIELESLCFKIV